MLESIATMWHATLRWPSRFLLELYGRSASWMTTRWCLPLVFVGVRGDSLRSVTWPLGLLELKTRVLQLAPGMEACLRGDDVGPESWARIARLPNGGPDQQRHRTHALIHQVRPIDVVCSPRLFSGITVLSGTRYGGYLCGGSGRLWLVATRV